MDDNETAISQQTDHRIEPIIVSRSNQGTSPALSHPFCKALKRASILGIVVTTAFATHAGNNALSLT